MVIYKGAEEIVMSSLEQKINYQLNKYPHIKKNVKRIYQHVMYAISPKVKAEGNIVRLSPSDGYEYFLDIMINRLGMLQIGMFCVCVLRIPGRMCHRGKWLKLF